MFTKTPTAKIAVNKNLVKQYVINNQETVFLKDGTEFEIELFNPTTETLLAKISINGKESDSGLVLKPGQRVFLERFLDDSKKYKFETYEVEDSKEVKEATKFNGLIEIFFYKETSYYSTYCYYSNPVFGNNTSTAINFFDKSSIQTTFGLDLGNTTFTSSVSDNVKSFSACKDKTVETGRVEKGKDSDQAFTYTQMNFSNYASYSTRIQIKPDSVKVLTVDEILHKNYCSDCGSKVKKTDRFCSQCGSKI